ncbi:MAG: pilus assembly protein N-terminal domain-containing protein [Candidatus Riflebacteria bacterium]|nr:pilus assembly protein N-terminal domain-containing protein [Candidatus Riflebacteria bacterium]
MKNSIIFKRPAVLMMVLLCAFLGFALQTEISAAEKLMIPVGKASAVPANGVKKIMAVKEGIVDVLNVSDEEIILSGLGLGETQLILWDMTGKRVYDVETYSENDIIQAKFTSIITNKNLQLVIFPDSAYLKGQVGAAEEKTRAETVAKSLLGDKPLISLVEFEVSSPSLQQRIEAAIKLPNVKVSVISPNTDPTSDKSNLLATDSVDLRIILQGSVNDQNDYIHLEETVKGFVKDAEKQISNLVTIENPIQVVFQAYILQVSKNNSKDLGIEWNGEGQTQAGTIKFLENAGTAGAAALPNYMNPLYFKNINRFDLISGLVRAWETQGKAKVLANPKLMVYANATPSKISKSGWFKEDLESLDEKDIENDAGIAFVNVGQTIYYPAGVDQAGAATYNPVDATLKLLIRDMFVKNDELKFSVFAKQAEPSFLRGSDGPPDILNRSIMTTLQIKDQQTVVLGGLINRTEGVSWKGVPVLSKIPYLGRLFKSKSVTNSENELVILLTPKIANRETDLAGKSKFETVPVPRRTDKLEKLHDMFQQIKSSHIPSEN